MENGGGIVIRIAIGIGIILLLNALSFAFGWDLIFY